MRNRKSETDRQYNDKKKKRQTDRQWYTKYYTSN